MIRTGYISVSHTHNCASMNLIADSAVLKDVKPDNILVDWVYDSQGVPKVEKVALGDFDIALKLVDEQPLRAPHAVGNVMRRSPEGQSGKGVAKASDIYSLGLVVSNSGRLSIYVMLPACLCKSNIRSASTALEVVLC